MREKAESGVLCHPATQRPLKSRLSGFSSEVSSQETKRAQGKEWVGKEFNGGLVWGTGSGRMATLLFVKDWACLAASLWPREIWGEKHHLCSCSGNKNQKVKKKSLHLVLGCRLIKCLNWRHPLSESWVEQQVYKLHISIATLTIKLHNAVDLHLICSPEYQNHEMGSGVSRFWD